jgi:hypothetical protein
MRLRKLVLRGILLPVFVIGLVIAGMKGAFAFHPSMPPSKAQVEFAEAVSKRMESELFSALVNEFTFTVESNLPNKVELGNQAVSLIFNDKNRDMRLIGTQKPLRQSDLPSDNFERQANALALAGGQAATSVEQVDGKWYYRRTVPLSNFSPSCALCHTNFGKTPNPNEWVGALALRVPIQR